MLFTLYGDYIYHRGGEIWAGSLIQLMACFGISEQAVRSELMRMCRKNFLKVRRHGRRSYYSLTERGQELIEEGAKRIFQRRQEVWDGRWAILSYSIPEQHREVRDRLRRDLSWLGFGHLTPGVYISPWDMQRDIARLIKRYGEWGQIQVFRADNLGPRDNMSLVSSCWDLDDVNGRYSAFLEEWEPRLHTFRAELDSLTERECFIERYKMMHEYDRFPFIDPGLPRELLPAGWLGDQGSRVFHEYHNLLAPGALRYFNAIFEGWPR